jgi:outer membrane protein assembly factor BamD
MKQSRMMHPTTRRQMDLTTGLSIEPKTGRSKQPTSRWPIQLTAGWRFPRLLLLGLTALLPLLSGCGASDDNAKAAPVGPVEEVYNNGVDALNARRYSTADDQFNAVEQNYPYSTWAVNAQLMSGYSLYLQNKYTQSIGTLDRFIQLHPAHRDIGYAYYLRALCYYEQIADIERDQKGTEQAMNALREVVTRFPDTSYANDAKLKIDLCFDHLAGKEMEIGRFYQKQHLYEAAIGRFQRVVDDFQTTNHVPEALARLTEIYLALGLKDQARKTAAVLGYNYPGSEWYNDSYAQLADDGLARSDGKFQNEEPGQRGFFSRAWHAVF